MSFIILCLDDTYVKIHSLKKMKNVAKFHFLSQWRDIFVSVA